MYATPISDGMIFVNFTSFSKRTVDILQWLQCNVCCVMYFYLLFADELSIVHLASSNHSSSYINAVIVEGFRNLNKYIVTQQPLPNTMNDFWKMVDQMEISVIVSLNEINSNDKVCKICGFVQRFNSFYFQDFSSVLA